jgi:agmatine deiminase
MSDPTTTGPVRRLPAEFEPHERTVLCWPARASLYGDLLPTAERAHAEVARAVARFEPVTVIAAPGQGERATEACGGTAHPIEVVELPIDDSWFRDSGPIYVHEQESDGSVRRVATDWVFNSWGGKFLPYADDAAIARRFAEHRGDAVTSIPMVFEGGSITGDGAGTLVTTTQCLLHPNRNPSMTRVEIEAVVRRELGVREIVWLPHGLALDDDTDGHVDNVAAFAAPGVLLVQGCDDPAEADHLRCDVNLRWARGTLDARGEPLEVVEIPVLPFTEIGGARVVVPYLNFYVGNGFVLVPVCGHPADDDMLALIGEQYPGREIVGLDVGAVLAHGGGGIHCITQQVPTAPATPAAP